MTYIHLANVTWYYRWYRIKSNKKKEVFLTYYDTVLCYIFCLSILRLSIHVELLSKN